VRFLLAVALLVMAGCVEAPREVIYEWSVYNDGAFAIDYEASVYGSDAEAVSLGTVLPSKLSAFTQSTTGVDMTAEIALQGDARASSGAPFAVDDLCNYRIEARWDGESWNIDVATTACS
jgi:hypothetical protein